MTITATKVKDIEGWAGDAALYRLSEPVEYEDLYGDGTKKADHVIVSAVVAPYSGPETYIFPADETGAAKNMLELDGSYRGGLSHSEAIRNAGWQEA